MYKELQDDDGADDGRHGTLLSTALLFATSGMGAGMLTLPYTVQEAGPVTAAWLMMLGCFVSAISTVILGIGAVNLRANTYGQVMERALKSHIRVFGISVVDSLFFFYLFAIIASYLIFLSDFLGPLISTLFGENVSQVCSAPVIIYVIAFGVIGPLACQDEMNRMKAAAKCSVVAVLFTCAVVVVKSWGMIHEEDSTGGSDVEHRSAHLDFSWRSFKAFGSMIFAFDIGSLVPAISSEIRRPTPSLLAWATTLGFGLVFTLYAVLAFAVYFAFEGYRWPNGAFGTKSDFTQNFPRDDPWVTACRLVLTGTFLCSGTLVCVSGMKSFYVCAGQAMGLDLWAPSPRQRVAATYLILVPTAMLAASGYQIGDFVSAMGSIGGCPEILAGPLLLVAVGQVGASLNWLLRVLFITLSGAMMLLLWSSSLMS